MTPLSIVFPYYRNAGMLARQYRVMADEWPSDLKSQVEVVVVDDGSPEPAIAVDRPADLPALRIYRITENRKWHQHAARNLGAHAATSPWLCMLDIDHVIPPWTLEEILDLIPPGYPFAMTFARRDALEAEWKASDVFSMPMTMKKDGETPKPHVNSFVISRDLYFEIGGYDEDLCGIYGTDSHFRRRLYAVAHNIHHMGAPLIRVDRKAIADASTVDWPRKEGRLPGEKKAMIEAALAKKKAEGRIGPKILDFPWERQL